MMLQLDQASARVKLSSPHLDDTMVQQDGASTVTIGLVSWSALGLLFFIIAKRYLRHV